MADQKDFLYPDLTPQVIRQIELVRRNHVEHPREYLLNSPYDISVLRTLRSWFDGAPGDHRENEVSSLEAQLTGDNSEDALYRETVDLFVSLKNAKPSAGDTNESMSYFRTIVALMEKMVAQKERALNLKNLGEFHATVLNIMETELTVVQKESIMKRIQSSITPDAN